MEKHKGPQEKVRTKQSKLTGKLYHVVISDDMERLDAEVNRMMKSDWVTVGGIAAVPSLENDGEQMVFHYMQSMVRMNIRDMNTH